MKRDPLNCQEQLLRRLLAQARGTEYGREHGFSKIKNHHDLCRQVPLRDYDAYIPYMERIQAGVPDVLAPGKPRYFAKSSGTVANVKYLPVTAAAADTFAQSGIQMLCAYARHTGDYRTLLRTRLFVQGSPELDAQNGILVGRMSGISYHLVPKLLRPFQKPSFETNTVKDWGQKVARIARETSQSDLRILAGIPPWVMMYFDELMELEGKSCVADIFPNLGLYIHGGVNFEPYRELIRNKVGRDIHTLDTYTASEGFFGFQEMDGDGAMTLHCDNGVYYEFTPAEEAYRDNPTRLTLADVEVGKDYALILNTLSGLWGYIIGDKIRFVDKNPYRFVVTGRVQEFTSLFGEHVIEQEVRNAMREATERFDLRIKYYTVAPRLHAEQGRSHHEWWIEFAEMPEIITPVAETIDRSLCRQNPYYKDLIEGNILASARIVPVLPNGFEQSLMASGKMDGQNKVSLLANNRKFADCLAPYKM
jgi:hypothetical protein